MLLDLGSRLFPTQSPSSLLHVWGWRQMDSHAHGISWEQGPLPSCTQTHTVVLATLEK